MNKDATPSIWWQRVSWAFVLLMILPCVLPRSPGLTPMASRRVAAFRIGCFLFGAVGWGATALLKRLTHPPARKIRTPKPQGPSRLVMPVPEMAFVANATEAGGTLASNPWDSAARAALEKADAARPQMPAPDAPRFAARYASRGTGYWLIDPWSLVFHTTLRTTFFGVPLALWAVSLVITVRLGWAAVWQTGLGIAVVWALVIVIVGWTEYRTKFPTKDTVRHAEVLLTPDGLYDILPDKTVFLRWAHVQAVRQYKNKIFVYGPQIIQNFPIDEFENEADAETFFDAAQTLWKSRGQTVPPALVAPSSPPLSSAFDL